jgi:hypothetical protein
MSRSPTILLACLLTSCGPSGNRPAAIDSPPSGDERFIRSLHARLAVNPADGNVAYLGWYDGRRNLLGPGGISAALVGMEPPDFRDAKLDKPSPNELRFRGLDHNHVLWEKTYRLDPQPGTKVQVTYRITNRRDEPFDAIIYSLADLPDATIAGDNRDLYIKTPIAQAHFHADITDPHFPGEQMTPYAMRSDSKRLEPGGSMEFRLSWELQPAR